MKAKAVKYRLPDVEFPVTGCVEKAKGVGQEKRAVRGERDGDWRAAARPGGNGSRARQRADRSKSYQRVGRVVAVVRLRFHEVDIVAETVFDRYDIVSGRSALTARMSMSRLTMISRSGTGTGRIASFRAIEAGPDGKGTGRSCAPSCGGTPRV